MTESFDSLALLVAIIAGVLNAYGLEKIPGWKDLPKLLKQAIVAVAAVLVPLGLEYLRSMCGTDGSCGPVFEPTIFAVVLDTILAWVVSQFAHGYNPLRRK
jgi:uncharacterized membrane protein YhdT